MSNLPWLARIQQNDPHFTSLHVMPFRKLNEQDLETLFRTIQLHNTHLNELYLAGKPLTGAATRAFARLVVHRWQAGYPLLKVNVGDKTLGKPESFRALIDAFREALEALKPFVGIASLPLIGSWDLGSKQLSEQGLHLLAALFQQFPIHVDGLDVSDNSFEPAGLTRDWCTLIGGIRSRVNLSACSLDDTTLLAIAAAMTEAPKVQLRELEMHGIAVTSIDTIQALAQACALHPSLSHFYLSSEEMLPGAADAFFSAYTNTHSPGWVWMENFGCSQQGVEHLSLILKRQQLEYLRLSKAQLTPNLFRCLMKHLAVSLRTLDVSGNRFDSLAELMEGPGMPNVTELIVLGCGLQRIGEWNTSYEDDSWPHLVHLDLSCNRLKAEAIVALADLLKFRRNIFPRLQSIGIGGQLDVDVQDEQFITAAQQLARLEGRPVEVTWAGPGR